MNTEKLKPKPYQPKEILMDKTLEELNNVSRLLIDTSSAVSKLGISGDDHSLPYEVRTLAIAKENNMFILGNRAVKKAIKQIEASKASEQELITRLRLELSESCNELEAYVNAEYPEYKREYLSNAVKHNNEINIINYRRKLAEEANK